MTMWTESDRHGGAEPL
uniref:Uncharacterized protein n=1 Tax=Anguilla anguilla TaxID=7936 RepID=A0A0E9TQH8_ANGAN